MSGDDDDKPTVVLDLNALKKQKLKQEEDLANIVQDLEFAVGPEDKTAAAPEPSSAPKKMPTQVTAIPAATPISTSQKSSFAVILFDFQSDFFQKARPQFPQGFDYQIATNLNELNKFLANKTFQICVFNYDVNPKAVNQLTAQIKQKFPFTKTMIMAKAISPEKAKMHQKTASGATGYYQFPLDAKKIEAEFLKIKESVKKVG
jgi:hypothetical protein